MTAQELSEESAFDLYLGDELKGVADVKYDPDGRGLKILDPPKAAATLALEKLDEQVSTLLSGFISEKKTIEGTGSVIADVNNFAIRLDLDPRYFQTRELEKKLLVKSTGNQLAWRNDIRSRWVFQEDRLSNQLGLESYISFWRLWAYFNGNLESNPHQKSLEEATLNGVFWRFQTQAGMLTTRGQNLVPALPLLGVGVFTQPLLQGGGDTLRGSNFEIFVPEQSKVYFYRAGKLIDSQVLPGGKQQVDTSRFPQGNYFVDVEVDAGGANAKQRYFYAKSGVLAPKGLPQISLYAGRQRTNHTLLDPNFFSASVVQRVMKTLDVGAHSYGDAESQVYVLSTTGVFFEFITQLASSWSTEKNIGHSLHLGGSLGSFNVALDYETSNQLQVAEQSTSSFPEILFDVDAFREDQISVNSDEFFRARLGYITRYGELRYEFFQKKLNKVVQERFHGPTLRLRILNTRKNDLNFETGYVFSNRQDLFFANINWQNYSGRSSFVNGLGTRHTDRSTHSWVSGYRYYNRDAQSLLGTKGSVQNQLDWSDNAGFRDIVRGDLERNFRYMGLRPDSSLLRGDRRTQFATAGEVRSSFGLFSSGATYLGANSQGDAQIVVDIENESEDGTTIVEIEGGQKTKAVGSKRLIFGVTPYREYKVSISPDDDAPITDYDTKVVDVLLYPGHSQLIRFTLRKLYIALGTLVDEKDNPILNAKIVGAKENSESDEDGLFQVEIAGSETLIAEWDGKKCEIVLPKLESEVEYYHEYGNVPCKSIPNSEP